MDPIKVSSGSYPIVFTNNGFEAIKKHISEDTKVVVVTDDNILKIFQKQIEVLTEYVFSFSPGEGAKNMQTVKNITHFLQEKNLGRNNTLLIALGGGVVGDITGFVASMYMRGVPYLQVPTTILSMVDSSIGGKTGVNTDYGKNLLGSFYHPQSVIIASKFLETLPEIEIKNGLAEMIKHAVIDSEDHLKELSENIPQIIQKNLRVCTECIQKSIAIKAHIVEQDEKETKGIRSYLNFGHTIGHALEKASDYQLSHGYAVSIGMVLESKIAEKELGFSGQELLVQILQKAGLPTALPKGMAMEDLEEHMKHDKKNEGDAITFALPKNFGEIQVTQLGSMVIVPKD